MEQNITDNINQVLTWVEQSENVKILYACESGSRAWGFASTDSDYDVRFLYVRSVDWYLSLDPTKRDVIELPVDGSLDINGWDLQKALKLMLASNPVLLEWLDSPIVYKFDNDFYYTLRDYRRFTYSPSRCAHHYAHMAATNWRKYIRGRELINMKKYLYVLRPLLAIQWIKSCHGPVPMRFDKLMESASMNDLVRSKIMELIAHKMKGTESMIGPHHEHIDRFILQEFQKTINTISSVRDHELEAKTLETLNEFFLRTVHGSPNHSQNQRS